MQPARPAPMQPAGHAPMQWEEETGLILEQLGIDWASVLPPSEAGNVQMPAVVCRVRRRPHTVTSRFLTGTTHLAPPQSRRPDLMLFHAVFCAGDGHALGGYDDSDTEECEAKRVRGRPPGALLMFTML